MNTQSIIHSGSRITASKNDLMSHAQKTVGALSSPDSERSRNGLGSYSLLCYSKRRSQNIEKKTIINVHLYCEHRKGVNGATKKQCFFSVLHAK